MICSSLAAATSGRRGCRALEDGAYGRRPPLHTSVSRCDTVLIESGGDLPEARAGSMLGLDTEDDFLWYGRRPPRRRRLRLCLGNLPALCNDALELVDGDQLRARWHLDRVDVREDPADEGPFSPSSDCSSAPTSPTSADRRSRTTSCSTRRRRSTTDEGPRASRSSRSAPTRRSGRVRRRFIAGGTDSCRPRARRPRRHPRPQHAPRPPHLRHRAPARRRDRRRIASSRPRRPQHHARHLRPPRPDRSRDARWTPMRVGSNSSGRTESFLPKLTAETALLSEKMEAAGIEPASADAPTRASTSLGRDWGFARTAGSRPTYRRASHPVVSRRRRLALLWRQPVR